MNKTEWGIRSILGNVFPCRDREHAEGMMNSTSPIIGPMKDREIVKRSVTEWEKA